MRVSFPSLALKSLLLVLLGVGLLEGVRAADHADPISVEAGYTVIDSVATFRQRIAGSGQKIRMKPGIYRVAEDSGDHKSVFDVTGSNNQFDLRGVTVEIDTQMLASMRGGTHELHVYRIMGNHNTFIGAAFEDVGEHAPHRSLNDFSITGDGNEFRDCTFITRGSAPYGYGDLFGKGSSHDVSLQKHAAMSVVGDYTRIIGCSFVIHTFGHAISIHGSQRTLCQDVTVEGALRLSDEILAETSGPAFDRGFKDHFDRPVEKGRMICLAEDGIRAYRDGERDGKQRLTGDITVIHCTVTRMRGGITLSLSTGKVVVEGCTVTESGYPGESYSLPSNATVRNSKGDAAYVPLLKMGYSNHRNADIELDLMDARHYSGNDLVALINGSGHRVKITKPDRKPLAEPLNIVCGQTYRGDEDDMGKTFARQITLINETAQPVLLSELSPGCVVDSLGQVTDSGKENRR